MTDQASFPSGIRQARLRPILLAPLFAFLALLVALGWALTRGDPSIIPSSWCVACRDEHPLFMQLKSDSVVAIHGLNYKDRPQDAAAWLDKLGDPYARTGADLNGRVAIDWGVYGVPETFVVSAEGRIAYKHIGPVTREVLKESILPLVRKLQQEAQQP